MNHHYTSGEIIAYQLASKLCELNNRGDNSDFHHIAEIHYRESIERGIAAGKITPYSAVTFAKLNLDTRSFEDVIFLDQEVTDYLKSEMAPALPTAPKGPATLFRGDGFSEDQKKITTLSKYIELETWTPIEAVLLVCGLQPGQDGTEIPKGAMGLDNAFHVGNEDSFHDARRILKIWNSRENSPAKVTPLDFVAWCKSKDIDTTWLADVDVDAHSRQNVPTALRVGTNKKTWDDAKLRALWEESILPGVTNASLAKKYGFTRQRISALIAKAKKQFSTSGALSKSTFSGLSVTVHKMKD